MRLEQKMVEELLEKHAAARDHDSELYCAVVEKYVGISAMVTLKAHEVFSMITDGALPSFEAVTRSRRRVQARRVDLRGKSYDVRHLEAERMREEMRGGGQ